MNTKSKLSQSQATDSDHYTPSGNERYLEILYDTYLTAPDTLSVEWRQYFDELSRALPRKAPDVPHEPIRDYFIELAQHPPVVSALQSVPAIEMMTAFRRLGHLEADIDPLKLMPPHGSPLLSLDYYGSTDVSLYQKLRRTYCHTIGFEYMHINRTEEVEWIRARIENEWVNFQPSTAIKQHLLERLVAADSFEKYLGFKYVGQKRFSLEGGDALIPLLDTIIHHGATFNVKEMVIGMAHRGRLNVLINVLGKSPAELFASFEGKQIQSTDVGDVKYHLGYSSDLKTEHGTVHARQRRRRDTVQQQVIPIQIHGDAAFAGQGVVMETFNMSQARWFTVGGSIHIVINNQVGFTTNDIRDTRSTMYCTDVSKMVEPPILHVNANDPEAVYFAALFAVDYRHTFKRDIVIDLVCYRRQGHNEADEPSATQPIMYQVIKSMPVPYQIYAERLSKEQVVSPTAVTALVDGYRKAMDDSKVMVSLDQNPAAYEYSVNW